MTPEQSRKFRERSMQTTRARRNFAQQLIEEALERAKKRAEPKPEKVEKPIIPRSEYVSKREAQEIREKAREVAKKANELAIRRARDEQEFLAKKKESEKINQYGYRSV